MGGELGYLSAVLVASFVALVVALRTRATIAVTAPGYRAQLREPLRLLAFAVALAAFVLIAPYTGDPTWDAIDASFMAIGCYVTAPWAVGTVYRRVAGRASPTELGLALVAWWIVASASYDLYLLARDGAFPVTSRENAVASTILYVLGGLFFSLGIDARRGLVFVFTDERWPSWHGDRGSARTCVGLAVLALVIAAPVVTFLVWVVLDQLGMLR